jgi:hypothetical protein
VPLPSSPSYHHAGHRLSAKRRRGFALLITITLLAFLVLLLVSLASLTRVETSVAANNQSLAQARQNALLALNIAVGQLQKYAGPDARVTARAEITSSAAVKTPYFTGVWDAAGAGPSAGMWLVSGSEVSGATAANLLSGALDPSDDTVTADTVFLVGNQSVATNAAAPTAAEKTRRIKLAKQDVTAQAGSVPGLGAAATPRIGRYAWWVGDQGVKASLALPDRADEVTYAPWSTPIQRRRIRQQIAATPNYFRASDATTAFTKEGFDPLSATGLQNVKVDAQLGLLTPTAGSMTDFARGYYHDFTTSAYAVLANTRSDAHSGLMRDLSLKPSELGGAFVSYANYASYMEAPGSTLSGADAAYPSIDDADSPRRRYKLVVPTSSVSAAGLPDLAFGVGPVINDFFLQFRVAHINASSTATDNKMTVRVRLYVSLWNPYTSALAPTSTDNLSLEITGLPSITVKDDTSGATVAVDLQSALPAVIKGSGGVMAVTLPFGNAEATRGTQADRSSWLPGRIYGWATGSGLTPANQLDFYTKTLNVTGWSYSTVDLTGAKANPLSANTGGSNVTGIKVVLKSSAGVLATYTLPTFKAIDAPANSGTSGTWRFGFATSLKQPQFGDSDRTWIKGMDFRSDVFSATSFGPYEVTTDTGELDPNQYSSGTSAPTNHPEFLLYRPMAVASDPYSQSSYNDAPLFELPRLPLLSVGELQHMQVKAMRAFAIGNSWGGTANAIFDRYFFSGLPVSAIATAADPDLAAGQPLPNWNLKVLNGSTSSILRAAGELSSQDLLQAGSFNVNSTSVAAWRAVLSSVRFNQGFAPADIENASGQAYATQKTSTALGSELFNADATLGSGTAAPTFLHFSQSAQETYFWKPANGSSSSTPRQLSTYAFRLGMRGSSDTSLSTSTVASSVTAQALTTDQIEALATEIVRLIKVRGQPFRNMEEFLGPQAGPGTDSLLEAAIATANLNADAVKPLDNAPQLPSGEYGAGLSSLTLTQANILTALAPYLRTRSDTFTIRSYGEANNPVTSEVAGRAWLEATVQRFPETTNSSDNIDKPTGAFGRRFKIISFRWLSASDI